MSDERTPDPPDATPPAPSELAPVGPPPPTTSPHQQQSHSVLRALLGPLVFFGLLALNFGKVAFIAVKGVKFFGTASSMLISIAAYTVVFGLPFAAGFVLLLLVHELGHALQMKREGIASGAPVFIPFVGAVIAMKELPRDAAMEARVGIAGPIIGTAGAIIVHLLALATGSDLLMALAFTGYFLNLFNLVPISPLDGGRIAAALTPKLWLAGILALAGLFLLRPNPVLLIIVLIGALDSWNRYRNRDANASYFQVAPAFRTQIGVLWIGLTIALVLLMDASHIERRL